MHLTDAGREASRKADMVSAGIERRITDALGGETGQLRTLLDQVSQAVHHTNLAPEA